MTAVGWATSASEGEGIGVGGRSVVAWWPAGPRPSRGLCFLFLFFFYFYYSFNNYWFCKIIKRVPKWRLQISPPPQYILVFKIFSSHFFNKIQKGIYNRFSYCFIYFSAFEYFTEVWFPLHTYLCIIWLTLDILVLIF